MTKRNKLTCKLVAMLLAVVLTVVCAMSAAACGKSDPAPDGTEGKTAFGSKTYSAAVADPTGETKIKLIRGRDVIGSGTGSLTYSGTLKSGDIIEISCDRRYIAVDLFDALGEQIVYSENGQFVFRVPSDDGIYADGAFGGSSHTFTARAATDAEISSDKARNLAVNPYDLMYTDEINDWDAADASGALLDSATVYSGESIAYPHAYANRVTRGEAQFYARNAIDVGTKSDGHGEYPYQSWGYDQRDDAEFVVYFGRDVKLTELAFVLRADFSGSPAHDTCWESAVAEFSDGSSMDIEFKKTGNRQAFAIDGGKVTGYVRIRDMKTSSDGSQGYAALTEFEAVGTEIASGNPAAVRTSVTPLFGGKEQNKFATNDYTVSGIKATMDKADKWFLEITADGNYKQPESTWTESNKKTMTVCVDDDNWKDAVYYSGKTEAFMTTGDLDYYYFLRSVADDFDWLNHEGKHTPHADHYQIGETYLMLADLAGADYKIADTVDSADYNIARPDDEWPSYSDVYNDTSKGEWQNLGFWWCDALYMAMNSYTLISRLTGESKYVEKAYEAYTYWKGRLYNDDYNLWYRDKSQITKNGTGNVDPETGKNYPIFWSRGNAWVLAALAKQLLYLDPAEYPEMYETYKADYIELAESVLKYQRDDGTWNASIVDPDYYAGKETTGTCGFIYAYCIGLSLGVIDGDSYYPAVKKAFDCVTTECMFESGQVGYMQTTGYQPKNYRDEEFSKTITHEFGMGLFMLACSGMMRICSDYTAPAIVVPADAPALV